MDILPRCVDMKDRNGEVTKGTYSDQLMEVVGAGAYDEEGHRNSKFLESTEVGPYPSEMQAAWDVLRNDAAANYGLEEGWREEERRERMGPLAEQTPAGVRNRGASERKRARTMEAFDTEGCMRTSDKTQGEGERRDEGDEVQGTREEVPTQENMDDLLGAVAEAIDEAEREAPETQENSHAHANIELEAPHTRGTHEGREATARQLANNFLQTMEEKTGGRLEGTSGEGSTRRRGKEPAP